MLFQVAALFAREWASQAAIDRGVPVDTARLQSAWLGFGILLLLLWPILVQQPARLRKAFAWRGRTIEQVMLAVLIGVSLRVVSWGFVIVQLAFSGADPLPFAEPLEPLARWQCPDVTSTLLILCTLVVATPLIEETVARGLLLQELMRRKCRFAVPLSAFLFAVLHRPEDIGVAFAFGMIAAYLLLGCKTLWSPIIAHSVFNAWILLDHYCLELIGLGQRIMAMSTINRGTIGSVMLIAFLWLSYRLARRAGAGG